MKVSLPDEVVTYDVASQLGSELRKKGHFEEAKVFYVATLEGRRRALEEEHKKILDSSLNNMGVFLKNTKDYEGALEYYQQALRVQEKVLGKTHPDTLMTITNMATVYMEGSKVFTKAEELYRQALEGYEMPLGKDHKDTKKCVINLAIMLYNKRASQELGCLIKEYPHLFQHPTAGERFKDFIGT